MLQMLIHLFNFEGFILLCLLLQSFWGCRQLQQNFSNAFYYYYIPTTLTLPTSLTTHQQPTKETNTYKGLKKKSEYLRH
jgi:hypothetical protein